MRIEMKRLAAALTLLVSASIVLFGQALPGVEGIGADEPGAPTAAPGPAVDERLQLAISTADYPVTPGDVYTLTFTQGIDTVVSEVLVESDYTVNLGVLGRINTRGLTMTDFKRRVIATVEDAYPRTIASLNITQVGLFEVPVSGAISRAQRVTAWGLSRLSEVVVDYAAPYTSLREVTVVSRDGVRDTYDLFMAIDQGELDQDPYVKPGDSVKLQRREFVVEVRGEVNEPGSFELLDGEGLPALEQFFQGYRPDADLRRLIVERRRGDTFEQISIGSYELASEFVFRDGDLLMVPARIAPRPVVFVEGAVDLQMDIELEADEDSRLPVYNRITRELNAGDTLYSLLLDIQDQISPFARLEGGYIIRRGEDEPIRVNMRDIAYQSLSETDIPLQAFDRVIIPLDQPYVTVTGDVPLEGRFPYNPAESISYYLRLAGTGTHLLRQLDSRVALYDQEGNELPADAEVQAGYSINVAEERDQFVTVDGSVPDPGNYPYLPDMGPSDYLRQAGAGAHDLPGLLARLQLFDRNGEPLENSAVIEQGFTIYLPPEDPARNVTVSGAVPAPEVYPFDPNAGVADYLGVAGVGVPDISAFVGRTQLYSRDGALQSPSTTIQPGFTVHVAEEVQGTGFVIVDGAVPEPGRYDHEPDASIITYLRLAGVGAPTIQARRAEVELYDADGTRLDLEADVQPEFTIFLPEPTLDATGAAIGSEYVVVSGAVPEPGRYELDPDAVITDYLRLAGLGGERISESLEMLEIFGRGGELLSQDAELSPEYTIYVPPTPAPEERFVIVSGEVPDPGRYAFRRNADYTYYLRQAGVGTPLLSRIQDAVQLFDELGSELTADGEILPEYTVHVPPASEQVVFVTGSVPAPGEYSFEDRRAYAYYLRLAGLGPYTIGELSESVFLFTDDGEQVALESAVEPNYTIHVVEPERQVVYVTGAVNVSGPIELAPGAGPQYYIRRSGGIDWELSADGTIAVTDPDGNRKPEGAPIEAGDTVHVSRNSFVYNFNRYFPVITGALGFIATIITLVTTLNQ